jgi:hypothetical protein
MARDQDGFKEPAAQVYFIAFPERLYGRAFPRLLFVATKILRMYIRGVKTRSAAGMVVVRVRIDKHDRPVSQALDKLAGIAGPKACVNKQCPFRPFKEEKPYDILFDPPRVVIDLYS